MSSLGLVPRAVPGHRVQKTPSLTPANALVSRSSDGSCFFLSAHHNPPRPPQPPLRGSPAASRGWIQWSALRPQADLWAAGHCMLLGLCSACPPKPRHTGSTRDEGGTCRQTLAPQHLEAGEDPEHSSPVSSGLSLDFLLVLIGQAESGNFPGDSKPLSHWQTPWTGASPGDAHGGWGGAHSRGRRPGGIPGFPLG